MTEKRSKPDQYQLRFPPGMRARLKAAADSRGRSMNAEIIDRLESSFKGWPRPKLPDALFERVRNAPLDQRHKLEREIQGLVIAAVEKELPGTGELHREFLDTFYSLLKTVPDDQREGLKSDFNEFWTKLTTSSR